MPFPRAITRYTRGFANEVALNFVGRAAFADLEHVGRKSGTVRHTPLRAFRTKDTVVIGLNFSRESDRFKNIQAAGSCRMRLGNEQLELGAPRLVTLKAGSAGMPWYSGLALKYVVHTRECVELPVTSRTRVDGPASPLPKLAVVTAFVAATGLAVRLLRRPSSS
jgi:deazaflavin-dependent oxidoreductase (nitroreductase family)